MAKFAFVIKMSSARAKVPLGQIFVFIVLHVTFARVSPTVFVIVDADSKHFRLFSEPCDRLPV